MEMLLPIMSMCMVFQVNEVSYVTRTFVSGWPQIVLWTKIMHHVIDVVDMTMVSVSFGGFGMICLWKWIDKWEHFSSYTMLPDYIHGYLSPTKLR